MGAIMERLVVPMPDIRTLVAAEARIVMALRLAIVAHKTGQDCRARLDQKLGSRLATLRLLIVTEAIGFAWPEAFRTGCPCSPITTADEMLFLNMIRHVVTGNRRAFDGLLCEMIDDGARQRVWYDIGNFTRIYLK